MNSLLHLNPTNTRLLTHIQMSAVNLKEGITEVLHEYTIVIKQLFDSLAIATRTDPDTPRHVFTKLIEKDHKLQQYVAQLEEHQAYQEKLTQLSRDMAAQDEQILDLATNLKNVEHNLYMNIQNERTHVETIKASSLIGGISAPDIVSYGHKISYTTSAPAGWIPTQVAVFKPPAPQEEQVRTGLLYSKIPDNILSYYSLEAPNKMTTNLNNPSEPIPEVPNTDLEQISSTDLKRMNIPLPPKGWKAGMPIPLPPKGWKPGDQILGDMNMITGGEIKNEGASDSSSSEEDNGGGGDVEWE